jgi:hypothetical protein
MRLDGQTPTKLIVAFRNYANARKHTPYRISYRTNDTCGDVVGRLRSAQCADGWSLEVIPPLCATSSQRSFQEQTQHQLPGNRSDVRRCPQGIALLCRLPNAGVSFCTYILYNAQIIESGERNTKNGADIGAGGGQTSLRVICLFLVY